jgi:PIN domain nuclease of toxin-antitoxin system
MLNLDTHILIHALNGTVTAAERRLLSTNRWGISAIVLWELAKLRQLGRIEIDLESASFSRSFGQIHVWLLDRAICVKSTQLDFESDPADELIAATSIVHAVPLMTRDKRIRKSKLLQFAR